MRFGITANPRIEGAKEAALEVLGYLAPKHEVLLESDLATTLGRRGLPLAHMDVEVLLAIGGDGTILRAFQLSEAKVFPVMVTQMVAVGEATGALDTMLNKIADFYDDEVDAAVEALTALLEPMLMIFLGVVIGGLVVAMYLPIFKLAGVVGG